MRCITVFIKKNAKIILFYIGTVAYNYTWYNLVNTCANKNLTDDYDLSFC